MSRFPFPLPFRKEGPFGLRDLQDEINSMFAKLWHAGLSTGPFDGQDWAPVVDVFEEPDRFVVRAEVPGLDASEIELTFSGGTLTLRGHKAADYTEETAKGLLRRERRFGSFARGIPLPANVDAAKVSATCRNGLLEITLPKTEESRPKPIKVEVRG